ncbi:MAG: glycosyltransferase family 2 protein [Patescibacteria group bacterium]|nr:glycosyltransferase family 2 protein [Patescibacteria group bacterium]
MFFSVIIPVYNEEKRIPKNIEEIFSFFSTIKEHKIEIIFVNDGSRDATAEVLKKYQQQYQFAVVSYEQNRGKGYAVRQGVMQANGDYLIFFDIDLATPLVEFNHLLEFMNAGDQVIIGSRRLENSNIQKSESKIRTFLGHGFTKISNILVPGIADFTCGFKCFSRAAAKMIFSAARIDRWGSDTELLYIAKLKRIPIKQMAVTWLHDDDSRVRVFSAIVSSLRELFIMKFNQLRGFYK